MCPGPEGNCVHEAHECSQLMFHLRVCFMSAFGFALCYRDAKLWQAGCVPRTMVMAFANKSLSFPNYSYVIGPLSIPLRRTRRIESAMVILVHLSARTSTVKLRVQVALSYKSHPKFNPQNQVQIFSPHFFAYIYLSYILLKNK